MKNSIVALFNHFPKPLSIILHSQESLRKLVDHAISETPILTKKISASCEIPLSEVPKLLKEVMAFLSLIIHSDQTLTPSLLVDFAWHELILCTRHYHKLCEEEFGRYIHHHPGGEEKENKQQFKNTLKLYHNNYGQPPVRYWGESNYDKASSADCGSCST